MMGLIRWWKYKASLKNYMKFQEDMKRCVQILINIDNDMKKDHRTRKYRRRFWYEFNRNHTLRKEIFEKLLKQYQVNIDVLKEQQKKRTKPKLLSKPKNQRSAKELIKQYPHLIGQKRDNTVEE